MEIKIGIIGFGGEDEELNTLAYETGQEIAKRNCILICGGLGGVMRSACSGAKHEGGITVGILPGNSAYDANRYIDIPIVTNMGEARNFVIVNSSPVLIAIGGGFGTLSEISMALKLGIPLIGLRSWDISDKIHKAKDPLNAVELAYKYALDQNAG